MSRRHGQAHGEARRALLPDLPAGQEKALLHLLTCPVCHEEIVTRLQDSLDDTGDENPRLREALQEGGEPHLRAALRKAHEARDQLATLQALSPAEQVQRLQEEPYPSIELLILLLERTREAQPRAPEDSLWFCQLASELTQRLCGNLFDGEEAASWHAQVECLRGNAERLLGQREAAAAAFNRATEYLSLTPERTLAGAELCRWHGVLLWDSGQLDEAEALLRQSSRVFGEIGPPDEEGASRVLLGLLVSERGEWGRAARLLEAGRATLDPARWPALAVQARYALALECARLRQLPRAQALLDPAPTEETESGADLLAGWWEGQVRMRTDQPAQAERALREAWCGFLANDDPAHAALCALDLAAVLALQGRGGEAGKLVETLAEAFRGDPALDALCVWARKGLAAGELSRLAQEEVLAEAAGYVRRVLRQRGHRVLVSL